MAARIELSFLYQTRTILRRQGRTLSASRRLLTTQSETEPLTDAEGSFLKEKARRVAKSPIAPQAPLSTSGTSISSTITASERRAFESALRFAPENPEPAGIQPRSPDVDASDTDVDNILKIFQSSIRNYQAEQGRLRSYPLPPQNGTDLATPPAVPTHDPDKAEKDLPEFDEISVHTHLNRFDEATQDVVRQRMVQISDDLHAAAKSRQRRGDIAMWEVCEAEIFSMAGELQLPQPKRPKVVGPPKFTFSRERSDDPPALVEAAERDLRASSPVLPESMMAPAATLLHGPPRDADAQQLEFWTRLQMLHNVYPAALLLALRLYIRQFPSSPFPHNLLPRVRRLGHASYVLGASPQFYNSLMSLVWQTRSSLREIDALLAEMQRGGVEYTEETYRILRLVVSERETAMVSKERALNIQEGKELAVPAGCVFDEAVESDGHSPIRQVVVGVAGRGGRSTEWWRRHEQLVWFPRVLEWLDLVAASLAAKDVVALEGAEV